MQTKNMQGNNRYKDSIKEGFRPIVHETGVEGSRREVPGAGRMLAAPEAVS